MPSDYIEACQNAFMEYSAHLNPCFFTAFLSALAKSHFIEDMRICQFEDYYIFTNTVCSLLYRGIVSIEMSDQIRDAILKKSHLFQHCSVLKDILETRRYMPENFKNIKVAARESMEVPMEVPVELTSETLVNLLDAETPVDQTV